MSTQPWETRWAPWYDHRWRSHPYMKLSLKPELRQFIDEQVRAGHFRSAEDVVEAAVLRLMLDPADEELDDAALAAIDRADAEFARGEHRPFSEFADELRQRFMRK